MVIDEKLREAVARKASGARKGDRGWLIGESCEICAGNFWQWEAEQPLTAGWICEKHARELGVIW